MDYYGLIAFCIGFGWIPIVIIVALIFKINSKAKFEREKEELNKKKSIEHAASSFEHSNVIRALRRNGIKA